MPSPCLGPAYASLGRAAGDLLFFPRGLDARASLCLSALDQAAANDIPGGG
jgi:hypothetical protein